MKSVYSRLYLFGGFFSLAVLGLCGPVLAQGTRDAAPHIFGFPGTACPPASRPYHGPENDAAMKQGVIYCVFARTATRVSRTDFGGGCPPGMKPVKEEVDYVWCVLPEDMRFNVESSVGVRPAARIADTPAFAPETPNREETPAQADGAPASKPSLWDRFRVWLATLFR